MSIFTDQPDRWLSENPLAFVINQIGFEVSPGHCLICPKREVKSVWEMNAKEWMCCIALLEEMKIRLCQGAEPDGFNVGINDGSAAGQTVWHAHIHLIPRYEGDHPNPTGGVRAVIPGKADYTKGL